MISEPALDRLIDLVDQPDVSGTKYEIVSRLGRGGMGVVYLARDAELGREVALKVLDPRGEAGASSGAAAPSLLEREARILAKLEHPGIVPVHDVGRLADGRLFYAMKRVRGERLDRWAATADRHARLAAFLRVCDAVAFAHAHGVVHRDLKPENVMVGEFGEVLVLDWGAARADAGDDGAVVGTPDYMPPEQARGDVADARSDVYALGTLLLTLAADARPLAAIAAKARADRPADRYPSVAAMAADVSRFLSGMAVEAHRETAVDRASRFVRRYRMPIAVVAAYLAARLLLVWLFRV